METIETPHIKCPKNSFAKTVLMPGDPLRSKYISEKYLKNVKLINNIRGIQGYTGEYKNKEISIMGSGMGIPSISIYANELYNFFNVENIIRIGSAGGISKNIKIRDIVIALGTSTNSNYSNTYNLPGKFCPIASYNLVKKTDEIAQKLNYKNVFFGNVLSHDNFYDDTHIRTYWNKMNILASEMESAGLYMVAARCNKNALTMMTISDNLNTGESLSSDDREKSFDEMAILALEVGISL